MTPTFPARHVASDNDAGIGPEAGAAMQRAKEDRALAQGEAGFTGGAWDLLRERFETDGEVFFVFNGPAADVLACAAAARRAVFAI